MRGQYKVISDADRQRIVEVYLSGQTPHGPENKKYFAMQNVLIIFLIVNGHVNGHPKICNVFLELCSSLRNEYKKNSSITKF